MTRQATANVDTAIFKIYIQIRLELD
jgi:hypothetical protein